MNLDVIKKVVVDSGFDGGRLDKTVKELFTVPWTTARIWIERGKISVDDVVRTQLDATVNANATLTFTPDARRPIKESDFDPKCIVFQDNHLVVAYKPADILTVPFEDGDQNTFDMQLRSYLTRNRPKSLKKKGAMASLMVVHRLDKLTSGLLVFPRSFEAKEGLAMQFRDHSAQRHYLALIHGLAKSKTIKTHIMQNRGDGIRGSCETSPHPKVRRSQKGQLAVTHVEVLELLKNASLIKCTLDTGRTNQIRIHLAEQGHPLIGERTYMRGFKGKRIDSLRLMLHAAELGFIHPISGEPMHFTAPPPPYFTQMLTDLKKQM